MILSFPQVRASVRLDGVSKDLFEQLACQLLVSFCQDPGDSSPGWPRVRLVEDSSLRLSASPGRRLRVVRRAGGFEARLRGGRVRFAGGSTIRVRVVPGLSREAGRAITLPLLRAAVFGALAEQGFSVLHAGAFEVGGRGVLVIGDSGAGKSTLAMLALRVGGRVVSDDSVLIGMLPEGRPGVAAFRKDAVLREAGERLVPPGLDKRLYRARFDGIDRAVLSRARAPEAFVETTIPERLFISRVDRRLRASRASLTSQADALAALIAASSPVFLAPEFSGVNAKLLPVLAAIVGGCVPYRVALGQDVLTDPDGVAASLLASAKLASDRLENATRPTVA